MAEMRRAPDEDVTLMRYAIREAIRALPDHATAADVREHKSRVLKTLDAHGMGLLWEAG